MPLIDLKNISKRYRLGETEVVALDSVDLDVEQGEFLVVWGASGSGKSTLLNILSTLDVADTGAMRFADHDINGLSDIELTRLRQTDIGVIFQSFNLVPVLSALENVMLPLQIRGESVADVRGKAERLLDAVGVAAHVHQRPDQLSGGQRQRVAIARALVTAPKVVIADEPTANLDSENTRRIIELMLQLNQDLGTTFVFSTHDPMLLEAADRKVRLADGRIVEIQTRNVPKPRADTTVLPFDFQKDTSHAHDVGVQESLA